MRADSEIKMQGLQILNEGLGIVEAERFVTLIQREKFDYTKWRECLFKDLNGEEISRQAMELQKRSMETSHDA